MTANLRLDDYVAELSDATVAEIAADYEAMATSGSTGDTALRQHAVAFDERTGRPQSAIAMSMYTLAFAVYRRLGRAELRRQGRLVD